MVESRDRELQSGETDRIEIEHGQRPGSPGDMGAPITRTTAVASMAGSPRLTNIATPIPAMATNLMASASRIALAKGVGGRTPAARKATIDDMTAFNGRPPQEFLARPRMNGSSNAAPSRPCAQAAW